MGKTILVSDRVNSFFTNNKIQAGTEIPTSGSYIKGDIIVNIGPTSASEPMWVCTEDGNPGTWGLVGVGGGSLISINESIVIDTAASEVSLGSLSGLVSSKDKLLVHYNSAYLMEGIDYEISADATKIIKLGGGTWNSNNDPDSIFTFELLKSVESVDGDNIKIDSKLTSITNNVVVTSPVTEVEIGIAGYNPNNDMLMVFKNSTFIVEGVDYTVNGNKIVSTGETWNSSSSANYSFAFVVFKEVAIINPEAIVGTDDIVNGSVTMDKLSGDVKQAIEDASNIDLSGYQEKSDNGLVTTDKTIVGAINELFQNANNGKELIATAIGEPLNSSDTFSAMSTGIDGLLSTFKTNMMNNGVSVESGDKFKSLIEKLALLADSEGKGIQYIEGEGTFDKISYNSSTMFHYGDCTITDLPFIPTCVFVILNTNPIKGSSVTLYNITMSSISGTQYGALSCNVTINNNSFKVSYYAQTELNPVSFKWYAIGVGEEDTTLLDSLKSILMDESVEVTNEDDMASLIVKTDNEFTNKNNTIQTNRDRLYNLMLEGGYEVTSNMTIDDMMSLLEISGIRCNEIKQIACGHYHTFILKNDGSVYSCGNNSNGQLGLGDTTNRTIFTQVITNITNEVKQIVCGGEHTFILKTDGSLWSCGYNNHGQLGLGDTTNRNTFTQVTTNINNDVEKVVCCNESSFIIKTDGTLWSCGYNTYGQLGLGDTTTRNTFTKVTTNINNDVKQIVCGYDHTFIIKNDGSLWACGYNDYGQLGLGDIDSRSTFTQVNVNINNDIKQISCGGAHTFILKNDGSVYSCGNNSNGELGLGDTTDRTTFTQVTTNINNDAKQIACGDAYTFILKNDGSVWSCGLNSNGQLGLGDTTAKPSFTQVTTNINNDVKHIVCGYIHTFILKNDGSVWSCGHNRGQLGLGNSTNRSTFAQVPRGIY